MINHQFQNVISIENRVIIPVDVKFSSNGLIMINSSRILFLHCVRTNRDVPPHSVFEVRLRYIHSFVRQTKISQKIRNQIRSHGLRNTLRLNQTP